MVDIDSGGDDGGLVVLFFGLEIVNELRVTLCSKALIDELSPVNWQATAGQKVYEVDCRQESSFASRPYPVVLMAGTWSSSRSSVHQKTAYTFKDSGFNDQAKPDGHPLRSVTWHIQAGGPCLYDPMFLTTWERCDKTSLHVRRALRRMVDNLPARG
jgi:hypothetical protein